MDKNDSVFDFGIQTQEKVQDKKGPKWNKGFGRIPLIVDATYWTDLQDFELM